MNKLSLENWTPLWSSIIDSSIWGESKEVKILWVTILAKKDAEGVVRSSLPGLARDAVLTIQECEAALSVLESPDKYSSSPENEGRRIVRVPGGWQVVNHIKYIEEMKVLRRKTYLRRKQQESRAIKRGKPLAGEMANERLVNAGRDALDGGAMGEQHLNHRRRK